MSDEARFEMVGGRVVPGTPWCVHCNSSAETGSHDDCPDGVGEEVWTPCRACLGGGVAIDGGSCVNCAGLGFWRVGSEPGLYGGYVGLAEAYYAQMLADDVHRGRSA